MSPSTLAELDRLGDALVQRVRALPTGDRRDLVGAIDRKNAVADDLASLLARYRNGWAGAPATRPADLFGGPVRIARQRPRRVEGLGGR